MAVVAAVATSAAAAAQSASVAGADGVISATVANYGRQRLGSEELIAEGRSYVDSIRYAG